MVAEPEPVPVFKLFSDQVPKCSRIRIRSEHHDMKSNCSCYLVIITEYQPYIYLVYMYTVLIIHIGMSKEKVKGEFCYGTRIPCARVNASKTSNSLFLSRAILINKLKPSTRTIVVSYVVMQQRYFALLCSERF